MSRSDRNDHLHLSSSNVTNTELFNLAVISLYIYIYLDRRSCPAALHRRKTRDDGEEADEARRDQRPRRRQRGDHQKAPGPLLQSH